MGKPTDIYDMRDEGDLFGELDDFPTGRKLQAVLALCFFAWAILGLAAYGVWCLFHHG